MAWAVSAHSQPSCATQGSPWHFCTGCREVWGLGRLFPSQCTNTGSLGGGGLCCVGGNVDLAQNTQVAV